MRLLGRSNVGKRQWWRAGGGGTVLPDTIRAISMVTLSPERINTVVVVSSQDCITPRTSVNAGPPVGPVSPGSTRRMTTRCPTQSGPRGGVTRLSSQ